MLILTIVALGIMLISKNTARLKEDNAILRQELQEYKSKPVTMRKVWVVNYTHMYEVSAVVDMIRWEAEFRHDGKTICATVSNMIRSPIPHFSQAFLDRKMALQQLVRNLETLADNVDKRHTDEMKEQVERRRLILKYRQDILSMDRESLK